MVTCAQSSSRRRHLLRRQWDRLQFMFHSVRANRCRGAKTAAERASIASMAPPTHHPPPHRCYVKCSSAAIPLGRRITVHGQDVGGWGGWGGVGVSSSCRFTKNKHLFRKCRNAVRQRKLLLVSQRDVLVGGCLWTRSSPLSQASVPPRSPDPEQWFCVSGWMTNILHQRETQTFKTSL